MASLHHHNPSTHHHQTTIQPAAVSTTTCCCCCNCSSHYNNHPSQLPQHSSIDPLLQSLASFLHQQQQRPNLYTPYPTNQPHNHSGRLQFHSQNVDFQHLSDGHDQDTHFVLSSLLQRISTLESSLRQLSGSNKHLRASFSLREAAAKVIQTHFRAFLVRRSRTLGQLQDLAFIKSSFNALRSSVLNKTHFSYGVVSHKAMDLLLKLDSVQGSDSMIRDGKRSVSGDIVRFLDFIDGVSTVKRGSSYKPVKNVRFVRNVSKSKPLNFKVGYEDLSRNQKEIVERLNDRVNKIRQFSVACDDNEEDVELEGFQHFAADDDEDGENVEVLKVRNGILVNSSGGKPRVKKSVSIDEHGNMYKTFTDDSDVSDDHEETMSEVIENDQVVENTEKIWSFDGERNHGRRGEYYEVNRHCQDKDGSLFFSAPEPLKMESRADMKRKGVKIVT